ncbi:MAG: type III-B CRISPR module-associated protein Cmr5 [Zestosphaera sp.]
MSTQDVVKTIVDCVNNFVMEFAEAKVLSSFRKRARETPTLVFSRGLAYAMVYLASRSNEKAFKIGLNARECTDLSKSIGEYIRGKKLSEEESGYVLYGALLAFAMKVYGIVSASTFEELIKSVLKSPIASARTHELIDWIKRFAEAYIAE